MTPDGDRVSTSNGLIAVTTPGTFGTLLIGRLTFEVTKKNSYLTDTDAGQIDQLS